jgi:hypothetical protein
MAMIHMARTAGFLAALFLITAAPAHAAFFPNFEVGLSPAKVKESPLLVADISQPATDTPIERFTLTLPAGFTTAPAAGATSCDPAALATGACPAGTEIGSFTGRLGASVPLAGAISKTGPDTFGLYVSILSGAISQVVQGSLTERQNGDIDLEVGQLPALPITSLSLRFWGGQYSLIRTPARCNTFTLDGKFTSRRGDLVIDRTEIPIACPGAPLIRAENVRFSDRRFKAGGSAYSGRTIIAWWLPQAVGRTKLLIDRRVSGKWRKQGRLVGTGNAGDNSLRWDGRLHGDKLEPGVYGVRVRPAGNIAGERTRFRILR